MKTKLFFAAIAFLLSACAYTSMNDPGDRGADQVEKAAARAAFFETRAGRIP
jgi:hypothetical protein